MIRGTVLYFVVGFATWLVGGNVACAQGQDLSLLPPVADTLPAPADASMVGSALPFDASVGTPGNTLPPPDDMRLAPLPDFPEQMGIGPDWYDPGSWISFGKLSEWDGSFEFGLNGTEGNSQALSYRTGFDLSRSTERYNSKIDLNYARSTANGFDTQHNALLNSNWDWKLMQTRWSAFTRGQLEYDQFKAFDLRLALNSGLSYQWIETETTKWKSRFGAGASREFGGPEDLWKPEAVFGFDIKHKLTDRQTLETVVDYYPTWEDFSDYRLVSESSWQVVLDEASNLSLKISVIDRYDSTPNGRKANDIDYAILLLWKL